MQRQQPTTPTAVVGTEKEMEEHKQTAAATAEEEGWEADVDAAAAADAEEEGEVTQLSLSTLRRGAQREEDVEVH